MEMSSTNGGEPGSAEASAYLLQQGGDIKKNAPSSFGAQVTLRLTRAMEATCNNTIHTNFSCNSAHGPPPWYPGELGVPDLEKTIISSIPPHP